MPKKTIMFAVVAGLVFALTPAVQAQTATVYKEDWQQVHDPDGGNAHPDWADIGPFRKLDGANVQGLREWHWANDNGPPSDTIIEWSSTGVQHGQAVSNEWEDLVELPGGDDWRYNGPSDSGSVFTYTNPGRGAPSPIVSAGDRGAQPQITLPYSSVSGAEGVQIGALVDGSWYFTDTFIHEGAGMISGGGGVQCRVQAWSEFVQDVDNDNWYLWSDDGGGDTDDPRDGYTRSSVTALPDALVGKEPISLPVGAIEVIGVMFNKNGNNDLYALDDLTISISTAVPGDVDGDGDVDLNDVGHFEAQFGMSGLPVPPVGPNSADIDEDGDVDLDDLKIMRDYYGAVPAAPAGAAVPEPATMTVLAIGGLMVLRRRSRKA